MVQHDPPSPGKLRLHPFPGMRYNPATVADVGEVTSPPYDVMDRQMIDQLLSDEPHNVVRLILPRLVGGPVGSDNPYVTAAKRMRRWREAGVLITDPQDALYVYEYSNGTDEVCGVVGAVELSPRVEQVVLPHEEVIPQIVADRLAMMSTAQANLEPILLVYDGARALAQIMAQTRAAEPLTDVDAADGTRHRLWAVTGPAQIAEIAALLEPHQALIADGHHRYATYLQLQARHRQAGDGKGPWDRGLALLIDQSQFPLRLGSIHRSIPEISLDDLEAPEGFVISAAEPVTRDEVAPSSRAGEIVLTDGTALRRLSVALERDRMVTDAQTLHDRLLPSWGVTEDLVGYHHTVQQTLRAAGQEGGVAVLLHPTTVDEVMAVARAGKMMPRKSTSFGPKPRMGLVMRAFADELPRPGAKSSPDSTTATISSPA